MNDATMMWWMHNTATGRRVLERVVPRSAIPPATRRQMCDERGHDEHHGVCLRCGMNIELERRKGR